MDLKASKASGDAFCTAFKEEATQSRGSKSKQRNQSRLDMGKASSCFMSRIYSTFDSSSDGLCILECWHLMPKVLLHISYLRPSSSAFRWCILSQPSTCNHHLQIWILLVGQWLVRCILHLLVVLLEESLVDLHLRWCKRRTCNEFLQSYKYY